MDGRGFQHCPKSMTSRPERDRQIRYAVRGAPSLVHSARHRLPCRFRLCWFSVAALLEPHVGTREVVSATLSSMVDSVDALFSSCPGGWVVGFATGLL